MKDLKQTLQKFELFYQHLNEIIHKELGFDFVVENIEYINRDRGYIDVITENIPCVVADFVLQNDLGNLHTHIEDKITKLEGLLLKEGLENIKVGTNGILTSVFVIVIPIR